MAWKSLAPGGATVPARVGGAVCPGGLAWLLLSGAHRDLRRTLWVERPSRVRRWYLQDGVTVR